MGEAKQRAARFERMKLKQPYCAYCGGVNPVESIDHVPPRIAFVRKDRPKGLEVLSCDPCNQGSKSADLIIAMVGRILSGRDDDADPQGLRKIISAVGENFPGLLDSMLPGQPRREFRRVRAAVGGRLPPGARHVLKMGDPRIHAAMETFGTKLGLALHYHHVGRIVPLEGRVLVRWFSNYDLAVGEFPKDIAALVGAPLTLRQGVKSAEDQFLYASKAAADGPLTAHLATFRNSFALIMAVSEEKRFEEGFPADAIFAPGSFRAA